MRGLQIVPILLLALLLAPAALRAEPGDGPDGDGPASREEKEREFRRRVDAAITKGAAWLAERQGADGRWSHAYDKTFPDGVTALAMLALLESEYNRWSETVTKGMAALRKAELNRTYTAALGIMVMESYRVPKEERDARREGRDPGRLVRELERDEKEWMKKLVDLIVEGRQFDAWGYPGSPPPDTSQDWPGDLSNTQYGLLGLKAASRCGIRVDSDVYMKLVRIVLRAQEKEGPRVKLVIEREETEDGYGRQYARPAEARGWRYKWPVSVKRGNSTMTWNPDPNDVPSGSMTCAGIASLAICHSELFRKPGYRSKVRDVQKAIDDGFAWLSEHWAVEENPGGDPGWHYYFLYGLERAGMLADRKWVGLHDWYREGAEYLLDQQGFGGAWGGDPIRTCFALLFLKRSTMPVTLTGLR